MMARRIDSRWTIEDVKIDFDELGDLLIYKVYLWDNLNNKYVTLLTSEFIKKFNLKTMEDFDPLKMVIQEKLSRMKKGGVS